MIHLSPREVWWIWLCVAAYCQLFLKSVWWLIEVWQVAPGAINPVKFSMQKMNNIASSRTPTHIKLRVSAVLWGTAFSAFTIIKRDLKVPQTTLCLLFYLIQPLHNDENDKLLCINLVLQWSFKKSVEWSHFGNAHQLFMSIFILDLFKYFLQLLMYIFFIKFEEAICSLQILILIVINNVQ